MQTLRTVWIMFDPHGFYALSWYLGPSDSLDLERLTCSCAVVFGIAPHHLWDCSCFCSLTFEGAVLPFWLEGKPEGKPPV